jgi:hypothetical protein
MSPLTSRRRRQEEIETLTISEEELRENLRRRDPEKPSLDLSGQKLLSLPEEIGRLYGLRQLRLRGNRLSALPLSLENLQNLEELNLIDNDFSEFPRIILNLGNLKILSLGRNRIENIPEDIDRLTKLTQLNLSHNSIRSLPSSIGNLRDLIALVLSFNSISEIPLDFRKLVKLREFNVTVNPLIYPPADIVAGGIMKIMLFLLGESHKAEAEQFGYIRLDLPEALKIAFKQYLIYFSDFVLRAKGKRIHFEVRSVGEGLEVEVLKEEATDEINKYLAEYMGFIGARVENIDPEFQADVTLRERDLLLVELRGQVRHLQSSLEIKRLEVEFLRDKIHALEMQAERYYEILVAEKRNPQPLVITSNVAAIAHATSQQSLTVQDRRDLVDLLKAIRCELEGGDAEAHAQVEVLAERAEDLQPAEGLDRPFFERLGEFLRQANDPESRLGRTLATTRKGIELCQKLGKVYNKVAQWVALPQIPGVFLG